MKKIAQSKRNWIEKYLKSLSEKQKFLENIDPYSDEEIKSFVKKTKETIPKKVEFYADTPNTVNKANGEELIEHDNIFNILNNNDAVPHFPMNFVVNEWERHGRDFHISKHKKRVKNRSRDG